MWQVSFGLLSSSDHYCRVELSYLCGAGLKNIHIDQCGNNHEQKVLQLPAFSSFGWEPWMHEGMQDEQKALSSSQNSQVHREHATLHVAELLAWDVLGQDEAWHKRNPKSGPIYCGECEEVEKASQAEKKSHRPPQEHVLPCARRALSCTWSCHQNCYDIFLLSLKKSK